MNSRALSVRIIRQERRYYLLGVVSVNVCQKIRKIDDVQDPDTYIADGIARGDSTTAVITLNTAK